jgi:hypothetical protein
MLASIVCVVALVAGVVEGVGTDHAETSGDVHRDLIGMTSAKPRRAKKATVQSR